MTTVGSSLRAIAARVCRAHVMERVIDPFIADLQMEHADALRGGRPWRARWIRLCGVVAFLKVLAWCGGERVIQTLREEAAALDGRVIGRAIGLSIAVTAMIAVPFTLWPLMAMRVRMPPEMQTYTFQAMLGLFLVPQAFPVALPFGVTFGVLLGVGGRAISRRSVRLLLLLAVLGSLASFLTMGWVIPRANMAFRVAIEQRMVVKGMNELTLGELWQRVSSSRTPGSPLVGNSDRGFMRLAFHTRLALSCSAIVLTLFALAIADRGRFARLSLGLLVCLAYLGYYFAMMVPVHRGYYPPPVLTAWLPNMVVALIAILLMIAASRRSTPSPSAAS